MPSGCVDEFTREALSLTVNRTFTSRDVIGARPHRRPGLIDGPASVFVGAAGGRKISFAASSPAGELAAPSNKTMSQTTWYQNRGPARTGQDLVQPMGWLNVRKVASGHIKIQIHRNCAGGLEKGSAVEVPSSALFDLAATLCFVFASLRTSEGAASRLALPNQLIQV